MTGTRPAATGQPATVARTLRAASVRPCVAPLSAAAPPGRTDRRPTRPAAGLPPCLHRAAPLPAMAATPAEPAFATAPACLRHRACAAHRPYAVSEGAG